MSADQLARHIAGAGRTVVFESGAGLSGHCWGPIASALADRARVVTYDRRGLGQSPPTTGGRRLTDLADDLVALLDDVGGGPAVLVGHSWGGPIVRVVAARRPELVAGLVLVDASDERCARFFEPTAERRNRSLLRMVPLFARLGLLRRMLVKAGGGPLDGTVAAARAMQAELRSTTEDLAWLRDAPLPEPTMPVTIITGTKPVRAGAADRACITDAHRARAAALPQGRWVGATRSAHNVPFDEPELVVAEVERLLEDHHI